MSEGLDKQLVECELCPKRCRLAHLERGDCRVRYNFGGELRTLVYGNPCSLHIDPIEKKPMFHFLPGTPIFSVATAGCNLHCQFCQNWQISQSNPEDLDNQDFPPEKVVEAAISRQCLSIAYTYTDPIIFYEYTYDTAKLARSHGLKNVLVTAGYINEKPLRELCKFIDGANVDLKSFSDDFYKNICGGTLKPVLKALKVMKDEGVLVEITNLIVPTLNDDMDEFRRMCDWIADNMGQETPLHISRFHPQYKLLQLPPTPRATLQQAARIAKAQGLKHVYVGNIRSPQFENTYCPDCGETLIERQGFRVESYKINNGRCPKCGSAIHGVWQ